MNLEPCDYTLTNSILVIHRNVNKPINLNLSDRKFTQLIFSNYININDCIETENDYKSIYDDFFDSEFNNSVELENNSQLTHLCFGYKFNQQIKLPILPTSLTHLKFGGMFDQSI